MKRLFTLMLVIAMVCCAFCAAAESESPYGRVTVMSGEVMPYESITGLYCMDIPSDFIPMDSSVLQSITDAMLSIDEDTFQTTFGFDKAAAETMLSSMSPEAMANYDFIYAPDFVGNINATATYGAGITPDMLSAFGEMLGPQLTAQYVSLGIPEESCNPIGIVTYGSNTFYAFGVELFGSSVYQYMTANANGDMLIFTFTSMDEETIAPILESMIIY